jgi:hypothetical protein
LPNEKDCYSNDMIVWKDGLIQSSTWNGFTVLVDVANGKIIESKFTK